MQIRLKTTRKSKDIFYIKYVKRILDLAIAIPALIILFPIFIIVGVIIKLDSSGPIIYRQKRLGKNKRDFFIYKFRTMVSNADKIGSTSTKEGDNRITRFGRVLRRTSIDELPQLINVFIGNMSLIGYRPGLRENYDITYLESNIFMLKPGITGYAQINGRSALNVNQKRNLELKYVEDISLIVDVKILISTIKIVIFGHGTI